MVNEINYLLINGKYLFVVISIVVILDLFNIYVNIVIKVLVVIVGILLIVFVLMIIVMMFMLVSVWMWEIGILWLLGECWCDICWLFISEVLMLGIISVMLVIGLFYLVEWGFNYGLVKLIGGYVLV